MINFELNETRFRIIFKHYTRERMLEEKYPVPIEAKPSKGMTLAIFQYYDVAANKWAIKNMGYSYCHPKDEFNKARGRKEALACLFEKDEMFKRGVRLEGMKELFKIDVDLIADGGRNFELREKVWRLYFEKTEKR